MPGILNFSIHANMPGRIAMNSADDPLFIPPNCSMARRIFALASSIAASCSSERGSDMVIEPLNGSSLYYKILLMQNPFSGEAGITKVEKYPRRARRSRDITPVWRCTCRLLHRPGNQSQ